MEKPQWGQSAGGGERDRPARYWEWGSDGGGGTGLSVRMRGAALPLPCEEGVGPLVLVGGTAAPAVRAVSLRGWGRGGGLSPALRGEVVILWGSDPLLASQWGP